MRVPLPITLVLCFLCGGGWHCEPDYPELPVFVEASLTCLEIADFGTGDLCAPHEDGSLDVCGPAGGCSPLGVCVSEKVFLGCTCLNHEDCQGWADYVSEALVDSGEEKLNPLCYAGGCIYSPVMREEEREFTDDDDVVDGPKVDGN